jgi:putative glutamine amidotransferase
MLVPIAIPEPSGDPEYNERSLPAYLTALGAAGARPVLIRFDDSPETIARALSGVHGILLPGSRYDIDPQIYGQAPIPECNPPDPQRTAVDELLLQDAFNLYKPVLGICGGLQSLNVWRGGTLIQHLTTQVDHTPGRGIVEAHRIRIHPASRLIPLIAGESSLEPWVNSSHHQAIDRLGDNLCISAVSLEDNVIEAVELDSTDHLVLAVQWHPERTFAVSPLSRNIFALFISAAARYQPRRIAESVALP